MKNIEAQECFQTIPLINQVEKEKKNGKQYTKPIKIIIISGLEMLEGLQELIKEIRVDIGAPEKIF